MMKSLRGLAALAVMAIAMGGNASANLLVNGGFEETGGAAKQGWGGFTYGDCGPNCSANPALPGWTVAAGGNVDIVPASIGVWKPAFELDHSLDLVGYTIGSISQSFATVAGANYALSFHYSKNVALSQDPSTATVTLAGAGFAGWSDTLSVADADAGTANAMKWLAYKPYTFQGTGNPITLTFTATNEQSQGGVFIDAVAVVPEPEAYMLALAALGVLGVAAKRRSSIQT
jgi:hypothetical protein